MKQPLAICRCCGQEFKKLKDHKIPKHDYRLDDDVPCPGSGESPKEDPEKPLWKDDPRQRAWDFYDEARTDLLIVGFAIVKQTAILGGTRSGTMECPLCRKSLRYRLAPSNNHCAAKCETKGCIHIME